MVVNNWYIIMVGSVGREGEGRRGGRRGGREGGREGGYNRVVSTLGKEGEVVKCLLFAWFATGRICVSVPVFKLG